MLEVGAQPWRSESFAGGLAVRGLALAGGRLLAEDLEVGAEGRLLAEAEDLVLKAIS